MSGESSSGDRWFTRLEPAPRPRDVVQRPDDPRLGEIVEWWQESEPPDLARRALSLGRAALIGFPQDEGVRRNHGRPGAAEAPNEIRRWLYRLTPGDPRRHADLATLPPLDLGNLRMEGNLEDT